MVLNVYNFMAPVIISPALATEKSQFYTDA